MQPCMHQTELSASIARPPAGNLALLAGFLTGVRPDSRGSDGPGAPSAWNFRATSSEPVLDRQ
jgi:hypothetical protein